ncbi:hypothetical protein AHAS_Ahas20G0113600 [Arachis hypogaea]
MASSLALLPWCRTATSPAPFVVSRPTAASANEYGGFGSDRFTPSFVGPPLWLDSSFLAGFITFFCVLDSFRIL